MDMLAINTNEPMKVHLENVGWVLAEGTETDGSKFHYIMGLPLKEVKTT
jgi:hypothetical protein